MAKMSDLFTRLNRDGFVPVKLKIDVYPHNYEGQEGKFVQFNSKMTSQCGVILVIDGEEKLLWFTLEEVEIIE